MLEPKSLQSLVKESNKNKNEWRARMRTLCCKKNISKKTVEEETNNTGRHPNFIQRVLTGYYTILHRIRWFFLVICLGSLALTTYYSTTMALPDSLEVQLWDKSIQYEQSRIWRQNLLLKTIGQTRVNSFVFWGVTPADTGNHSKQSSLSSATASAIC